MIKKSSVARNFKRGWSLAVGDLEKAIQSGGGRLLENVELFDVYQGA